MVDEIQDPPKPFFLVVVVEGEAPSVHEFKEEKHLVEYLRDHFKPEAGTRVQVYIFQGDRLHITQGTHKYLVPRIGQPIPLFTPPSVAAVCKSGDWFDPEEDDEPAPSGYTSYPAGAPAGAPAEGLGDDPDA